VKSKTDTPNEYSVVIKCKWHTGPGRKLCGAERRIKPQDRFQVKFCREHQADYARQRRRERSRTKRKAAKTHTSV
jgi:hypothetical protein